MKKKFLVIMLAFSMVCSSMYSSAKSGGTITVISKTKTFSVPKKYGKIKKISYSYPDKKAKGKVTVKQTGTKIKITGKKNGRVNVKIRFKSNAVKSYKLLVNIKKNKPKVTATPVVTASASPVTSPAVSSTSTPTVSPKITPIVSPTLIPTSSSTVEPTVSPTAEPTVRPTVVPTSSPIVRPTSAPTSSPIIKPTVSPTSVPEVTIRPTVSVEPTSTPTTKPIVEPTLEPTFTPLPSDDVEHEDIASLKTLDEEFDVISTNYYEYTKAFIDRYFNDDGICTRFYIRATTIKNITDETRVPDCHVKFYDENGYFVCEYQNSNDSGSTWHKTLKPNEESIILYLAGTSPSGMGVTSEDFSKRVKYWKLVDIED